MGKASCLLGCSVSSKNITLFRFPAGRTLRAKWFKASSTAAKPAADISLCSRHFLSTDYEKVRGRVRLKAAVVPSVFETSNTSSENGNTEKETINNAKSEEETEVASNLKTSDITNKNYVSDNDNKIVSDSDRITSEQDGDTGKEVSTEESIKNDSEEKNADLDRVGERVLKILCEEKYNEDVSKESTPVRQKDKPAIDNQDIEELLTNYHIKQNNIHLVSEEQGLQESVGVGPAEEKIGEENSEPVFIEVAVGKDTNLSGQSDCLMLLEDVQVDVDPNSLMPPDPEDYSDDDVHEITPEENNPISLLTSSDEDEVIIQEPVIDTVEVSDATDEDDVPLQNLVQPPPKKKRKESKKRRKVDSMLNIMWGKSKYYCVKCKFVTDNRSEYTKHKTEHSQVLLVCQTCGYMTSSQSQISKHEKLHKDEKRYECRLCSYKAKYSMSLAYHMKSHQEEGRTTCPNCSFSGRAEEIVSHLLECSPKKVKRLHCSFCRFRASRPSELKKHINKKHREIHEEDNVP